MIIDDEMSNDLFVFQRDRHCRVDKCPTNEELMFRNIDIRNEMNRCNRVLVEEIF